MIRLNTVSLAWHNTFQNKKRTAAAVGGIAFSILLVFMQLGLLEGAKRGATMLYDYFDFDLVVVSDTYQSLDQSGQFDAMRMYQARVVPGVASVSNLNVGNGKWLNKDTDITSSLLLIGTDLDPAFVNNQMVREGLPTLVKDNTIMIDLYSQSDFGDLSVGRKMEINGREATIASHFTLGVTLFSEGAAVVSNDTFHRLVWGSPRNVSFGLVKIEPGEDPDGVLQRLRDVLPDDVLLFRRAQLIRQEQDYYITVKPMGILFQAGVFVAFVVGVVILFQVLSTDIQNRLNEFATLKAVGFTNLYIYSIGVKQGLLFAAMSYIPAFIMGAGTFKLINVASKLPVKMTMSLALFVLTMALVMCAIASVLALQKVRKTDPAELF